MKEGLSFMAWSKTGPHLVVGSNKGAILFYNKRTQRKVPVTGLHAKRICGGAWNSKSLVSIGSEDRHLSVYNVDGESVDNTIVKSEPLDILFSEMKVDKKAAKQENGTISINLSKKTIYLYNLNDKDNPIELAFQPKYGQIITYKWFGDGYMMLGFSEGYFVVISTRRWFHFPFYNVSNRSRADMKEIGQELFSCQFFNSSLTDICFSHSLQKTAICGDSTVKVVNATSWKVRE